MTDVQRSSKASKVAVMVSTVNREHYAKRKERGRFSFREKRSKIYNLQTELSLLAVHLKQSKHFLKLLARLRS